jgi:hypothetical protein
MGGAFVAVADDGTTAYWSPGGLPLLKSREVAFMHSQQFDNLVKTNFISYVHPTSRWGAFGVSWLRLGVEDIPKSGYVDGNENNVQDFDDKNKNGVKDPGELYIERPIIVGSFDGQPFSGTELKTYTTSPGRQFVLWMGYRYRRAVRVVQWVQDRIEFAGCIPHETQMGLSL